MTEPAAPALLKRLLARLSPGPEPAIPPLPCPARPVCMVGDIHGRADLLDRLLEIIAAESGDPVLIFAGDYIDRGPDSAAVLERLAGLGAVCLMGNHERMLLDFLDAPAQAGVRWLGNGGAETLASFGVGQRGGGRSGASSAGDRLAGLAAALRAALPPGQEAWLRGLPLWWQGEGLGVVHAGADPDLPLERQTETALLWGHRGFHRPRADGLWIAHGHVIVEEPRAEAGRIAVDTGAWRTGRLTGAWIAGGAVRFLQT